MTKKVKTIETMAEPVESIDDSGLRRFIGYSMKRCYMTIQADLLNTLAQLELRASTFSALSLICDNPGLSQTQLANALNIERSGVVLIVDELEGRELINRVKVPTDRRSYALRSTGTGLRLRDKAQRRVAAHEDHVLQGLTEYQKKQLLSLLGKIECAD